MTGDDEASAMESIRRVIGSLANANPNDDVEVEKLQLCQLMSRITNVLSLQCIIDELVTQVTHTTLQLISRGTVIILQLTLCQVVCNEPVGTLARGCLVNDIMMHDTMIWIN